MLSYNGPNRLDQTVFTWSENSLIGTRGIGPVSSSLSMEGLRRWVHQLGGAIWAAQEVPGNPSGVSYLVYDDVAAVLQKWPVHDENGRPGSTWTHVLTGPVSLLSTDMALDLIGWDGWMGPDSGFAATEALLAPDVAPNRVRPVSFIDGALVAQDSVQVLAQILAAPECDLIVTGARAPSVDVIRVVVGALGDIGDYGSPWTFASREGADSAPAGARISFLVQAPGFSPHRSVRTRIEIQPDGEGSSPGTVELSRMLVEARIRRGLAVPRALRAQGALDSAEAVARWAEAVQFAPGVVRDTLQLVHGAVLGGLSGTELAFVRSRISTPVDPLFPQAVRELRNEELRGLLPPGAPRAGEAGGTDESVPQIRQMVLVEAARRALSDPQARDLVASLRAAGVPETVVESALEEVLRGEPDQTRDQPEQWRTDVVLRALDMRPEQPRAGGWLDRRLRELRIPEMLRQAQGEARQGRAGSLIRRLANPDRRPPIVAEDAPATTALLEANAYFYRAVLQEFGSEHEQLDALVELVRLAYGQDSAADPYAVEAIIDRIPEERPRLLLQALGLRLPEGPARWHVQRLLGVMELERLELQVEPRVGQTHPGVRPGTAAVPQPMGSGGAPPRPDPASGPASDCPLGPCPGVSVPVRVDDPRHGVRRLTARGERRPAPEYREFALFVVVLIIVLAFMALLFIQVAASGAHS